MDSYRRDTIAPTETAEDYAYRLTHTGRRALAAERPSTGATAARVLAAWDAAYDEWSAGRSTSPSVDDLAALAAEALDVAPNDDVAEAIAHALDAAALARPRCSR